jgi:hypothetical protein
LVQRSDESRLSPAHRRSRDIATAAKNALATTAGSIHRLQIFGIFSVLEIIALPLTR